MSIGSLSVCNSLVLDTAYKCLSANLIRGPLWSFHHRTTTSPYQHIHLGLNTAAFLSQELVLLPCQLTLGQLSLQGHQQGQENLVPPKGVDLCGSVDPQQELVLQMQNMALQSHGVIGNLEVFVRHYYIFNKLLETCQTELVASEATAEFLNCVEDASSILCQGLVDLDLQVEGSKDFLGLSNLLHSRGF